MNFQEILVGAIMPTIKTVEKAQLSDLLEKLKEAETKENVENDVKALHGIFKRLDALAQKTKTKIDDNLIDGVVEALEEFADDNDISL